MLGSTRGWLRYRLPRQYVRDRCIGQKQRWFLLRLTADEAKVRFDSTDQPEFDRWRWVDYWTPVREVVYFKRRVYARALHELGKLIFPNGLPPYPDWWPEFDMPSQKRGAPGPSEYSAWAGDAQTGSPPLQGFTTARMTMPISRQRGELIEHGDTTSACERCALQRTPD